MSIRKVTVTAILAGALIGAAPVTSAGATGPPVEGIWRSDGYSTIVSIHGGRATFYETTGVSCLPGPVAVRDGGPNRFVGPDLAFTVRAGRALRMDGSAGEWHLHRLPRLPDSCTRPGPTGPLAVFDVFWQTYAENYPFFAAKGIDWRDARDTYRSRVRPGMTGAELFRLLRQMIEPLGDAHTGIRTPDQEFLGHRPGTTFPTLELEQRIRPYIEQHDLRGPLREFGNGYLGYRDLPGRVGYLRVIRFAGYSAAGTYAADEAELDRALDAILSPTRISGPAALRGLIVDLRVNGGGHDALGLRLASRLTRTPYLAYVKGARNDPGDPHRFTRPQPVQVPAGTGTVYAGPVAILTGGSAMSAGETFTMATFGRAPRPVRIGDHTQGVFSDTLIRSLPNGWQFILPNEEFRTREGDTFDGAGIPPDIRTPVFTDQELAAGRDSAFAHAVALLRRP